MKYKEFPYIMRYLESYYSTKESSELKEHVRKKDNILRIKVLDDKDFPIACTVSNMSGKKEYRYFDDNFWCQMREDAHPEEDFIKNSKIIYSKRYPSACSEDDIDQGWDDELSVIVEDDKDFKRIIEWKYKTEKFFVLFNERFWTPVTEPYYERDLGNDCGPFEFYVKSDYLTDRSRHEDISRIVYKEAYSFLDKECMLKRVDKFNQEHPDNTCEIKVDDVEIFMPEVFHFGNDIPNLLKENPFRYIPEEIEEILYRIEKGEDAYKESYEGGYVNTWNVISGDNVSCFLKFLQKNIPEELIKILNEEDEPYYHLNDWTYWKALHRLLNKLVMKGMGSYSCRKEGIMYEHCQKRRER